MDEIIQIKCPFCGSVLSVKTQPGIESKNVGCPVCRHKYPFTQFKCLSGSSPGDEPPTDYARKEEHTSYRSYESGQTEMPKENLELGRLTVDGSGISYRLMPGRNVVGRKAAKSEAGIQIYTADSRAMSREHIVIDVKNVPGKGFVHTLSLYKEKVNPTFIGSEPLVYGDRIVLTHGDVIRLPDTTLKFELPDEEATEI
jgi:hypothetical protein